MPGQKIVVVLLLKKATSKFGKLIQHPQIGQKTYASKKFKQLC